MMFRAQFSYNDRSGGPILFCSAQEIDGLASVDGFVSFKNTREMYDATHRAGIPPECLESDSVQPFYEITGSQLQALGFRVVDEQMSETVM